MLCDNGIFFYAENSTKTPKYEQFINNITFCLQNFEKKFILYPGKENDKISIRI